MIKLSLRSVFLWKIPCLIFLFKTSKQSSWQFVFIAFYVTVSLNVCAAWLLVWERVSAIAYMSVCMLGTVLYACPAVRVSARAWEQGSRQQWLDVRSLVLRNGVAERMVHLTSEKRIGSFFLLWLKITARAINSRNEFQHWKFIWHRDGIDDMNLSHLENGGGGSRLKWRAWEPCEKRIWVKIYEEIKWGLKAHRDTL